MRPLVRPLQDDFRRALEEIKLRAPVEDVVREYVPELKKRGALWQACCPFHEERTPSFKVDPRRGTWHCFGACSEGGDQIRFVERIRNVGFRDALEILAARVGVELPRGRAPGPGKRESDKPILRVLERATRFFESNLAGDEGREAREYLSQRGLSEESARTFRLGWAPASGRELATTATQSGVSFEELERAGLSRRNDRGHPYDFFRGRLVIPIADLEGRVVGFGARQLASEPRGPKYVNSPETDLFRKSRLVYGIDHSLDKVRKSGHLILVEGYTDVIAAHQEGVTNVAAVLGTSTTTEHAGVVRRTGARRVSLVFDGDEAGARAARRALHGLLPLGVAIEVVSLPPGQDPCDLLMEGGAEAFEAAIEGGREWFSYLVEELEELAGAELSEGLDGLLELLARIEKPVHREDLMKRLSERLGLSPQALVDQWSLHPAGRSQRRFGASARRPENGAEEEAGTEAERGPELSPGERQAGRAFEELLVAALRDEGLVPAIAERVPDCPDLEVRRILEVLVELYEGSDSDIDEQAILTALVDDPARQRVVGLFEKAARLDAPRKLLDDSLRHLRRAAVEREKGELSARILELQLAIDRAGVEASIQATKDVLSSTERLSNEESTPSGTAELADARAELQALRQRHGELVGTSSAPSGPATAASNE